MAYVIAVRLVYGFTNGSDGRRYGETYGQHSEDIEYTGVIRVANHGASASQRGRRRDALLRLFVREMAQQRMGE